MMECKHRTRIKWDSTTSAMTIKWWYNDIDDYDDDYDDVEFIGFHLAHTHTHARVCKQSWAQDEMNLSNSDLKTEYELYECN